MTPRDHIRAIQRGGDCARPGFWLGNPHPDTLEKFRLVLGTNNLGAIQNRLGDDVRWITPQHDPHCYSHPEGQSMRPWRDANPHGLTGQGLLSDATSIADLDRITFPEAKYLNFDHTLQRLQAAGPFYRLGGM